MIKAADTEEPAMKVVMLRGLHCASCVQRVEAALGALPGVDAVAVNLALARANIHLAPGANFSPAAVTACLVDAGYDGALITSEDARSEGALAADDVTRDTTGRQGFRLFLIAAIMSFLVMLPMIAAMVGVPFRWPISVTIALTALVVFGAGHGFFGRAVAAFRHGSMFGLGGMTMDTLVALGTSAAFFFSLYLTVFGAAGQHSGGAHQAYFESAAMITTFVLLGRWLEGRATRATAAATRDLMALRPEWARVWRHDKEEDIPVSALTIGDLVVVPPGAHIPADGLVQRGDSDVDEALITGESMPVLRTAGSRVIAGSVNGAGRLVIQVTATGSATMLARMIALVTAAQSGKAPIQRLVDRVSAIFVPLVLLLALFCFVLWWAIGGRLEPSLVAAVSVLVIACPCALGLATPTAIVAGLGAGARHGILIRRVETLEQGQAIDRVVFDKTGTLTEGKPTISQVFPTGDAGADVIDALALAAAAQRESTHPLARAFDQFLPKNQTPPPVSHFHNVAGKGIIATVAGHAVLVGNQAHFDAQGLRVPVGDRWPSGLIWVAIDGRIECAVHIRDGLRETAAAAVQLLKDDGIGVSLLSGDTPHVAKAVAETVGIAEWQGGALPEDKLRYLTSLSASGHRTLMVGDGINDAPALAAADIGMALGSGSDAAMNSAGVTLLQSDPRLVAAMLDLSRRTWRILRQNLFWAFCFNGLGIPLAAAGLLRPEIAGAAMAASSLCVVCNALRLQRWRPSYSGA